MIALRHPAGATGLEIGQCRLDDDSDMELGQARAMLSKAELARAAGFRFGRDRWRFVRARGCLRKRLGEWLGTRPETITILQEENGKPFVAEPGLDFSLSHSGGLAVIALSGCGGVGIDLEFAERHDGLLADLDGLSRTCLVDEERRALQTLDRPARQMRFLAYWTAKEAWMKLTGEGLSRAPDTIALKLKDGVPVGYRRPRAPAAGLRFVDLGRPDAVCCLATRVGPMGLQGGNA